MERDKGSGWPERHSPSKPTQPEQQAQGRGIKSPESDPRPSVWDLIERRVKIEEEAPYLTYDDYIIKLSDVNRTLDKLAEKGTSLDSLIQDLYESIIIDSVEMSVKEFRQFRSQVEPMSDDEIREEIRKSDEERKRKAEKKGQGFLPCGGIVKF